MHFCLTETAVQESNDRFHYCKYNNKSALHNTLLHIIHSTVVGRISNVFIVVYSHSLCTSVEILRSGIDCLCKHYILSSASSTSCCLRKSWSHTHTHTHMNSIIHTSKVDLDTFTCSTKFGGSASDSTPV